MRVRVERIGGGRRRPEVDYVETDPPRKRRTVGLEEAGTTGRDPWSRDRPSGQRLRLPWRINTHSD
jgi:hypothetical protein